jgi:outer membrane lipoprotein-sorting protein
MKPSIANRDSRLRIVFLKNRMGLFLAVVVFLAVPLSAQTVDEILSKNAHAHGGLEKIKSINSLRITGKITAPSAPETAFSIQKKRPNLLRIDLTDRGKKATQAFDGSNGWVTSFLGGDALPASEDELKSMRVDADFDGPLIDYRDKGDTIEFVGKENVNGTAAYKLKVTLNDGNIEYFYLDAATGLELKQTRTVKQQGQNVEVTTSFENYKQINGLTFPFSIKQTKGNAQEQITIEKVETNTTADDSIFKMPAASQSTDER